MYRTRCFGVLTALIAGLSMSLMLAWPADALMLISRGQEIKIGKQVQEEVIQRYGLSYDQKQIDRVQSVGAKIAAVSTRQNIPYSYTLVDSGIINAFSAPGGPVMVTEGLAHLESTDGELAFVLGHETGHIAAQHGRDGINRALITQGLGLFLLGGASQTVLVGANVMYTLYDRGYSRSQEYQADSLGVQFMQSAGYDPTEAVKALAKLGMDRTSGLNRYLTTHPDTPNRVHRVAQMLGLTPAQEQELIQQAQQEMGARKYR